MLDKLSYIVIIQFVLIATSAATFGWGQEGGRGDGGSNQCSTCSNHFGQASNLNHYSCRDINIGGCSSDGAVGCGGSLNVPSSFSCNRNNIKQTPYSLCVGGNLAVSGSLQVRGGGVYYGLSQTGNVQFTSQGSLSNGVSPISYGASTAQLQSLSQYWSSLSTTGSTSQYWGQLWFTCSYSSGQTQVFSVSGSALSTNINFYLCSNTHTIIINVYGSSASLSNSIINYGGLDPSQIVFNFYQSTTLQLSGCYIPSTVLAPRASCSGWNSKVGQLFSWSFSASSSFQFVATHNNNSCWFNKCAPVPCTTPTVAPTPVPTVTPTPVPVTTPTPVIVPPPFATSGNCTVCTNIFQNLSSLNFFSCSHSQLGGCSSQGPVGCGGNLHVTNSLSCGNSGSNAKFAVAVAGILSILGSVNVNSGSIWYGQSQSGTVSFNSAGGSLNNGFALNFNASASTLTTYSSFWAGLPLTGTSSFFWGTTTLTCSSATTQVFSISGSALSSWYTITFANCNAAQTIIIGVTGGSVTLSNVNLNLGSLSASQVIFNFHQCTSLQITYAQFPASILAPFASCAGSNSRVGQLFVGSMTSSLSFNFFSSWGGNCPWFNRCVRVPCGTKTTVAPTTTAPTPIATTAAPTTQATTAAPTTAATTAAPTTQATTAAPTTAAPTVGPTFLQTDPPTTQPAPTTVATTVGPTFLQTNPPTTQPAFTNSPPSEGTNPPSVGLTVPPVTTVAPTVPITTSAPTSPVATTQQVTVPLTTQALTTRATTQPVTTQAVTQPATTQAVTQPATTAAPTTVVVVPTITPTLPPPSDGCENNGCLGGLCCAGMCYDRSRQNCVNTPNGSVLCGFQEHGPDAVCGGYCYDNISYVCCGNTIYGRKDANIPCAAPPNPYANEPLLTCGGIQCDEPGYLCCNQTAGSSGPTCYWPTAQSCNIGSKGPILCGIYDKPCGTVCYNTLEYTCVNDALVQLPK